MIQYSAALQFNLLSAAYWIPRLRGV
jgi:hypothetical protein